MTKTRFRNCFKKVNALAVLAVFLSAPVAAQLEKAADKGTYRVQADKPEQYIWGLGFEIQSDAIGSGNLGLPETNTSVPHDLVPSERERLYNEMLKGFRYCRIAGGLYFRGTTPDQKELRGRWDTQTEEIREMIHKAGIEGISLEYWSPTPYWKANGRYVGKDGNNRLRCFGKDFANDPVYMGDTARFLSDFGQSLVNDIFYFERNQIPVKMWGLQNEPSVDQNYSSCVYTTDQYTRTFNAVAPLIKSANPNVSIIVDSESGPLKHAAKISSDPQARRFVDAWVWHQIGADANTLIDQQEKYHKNTFGLPVFQNEYEYLTGGTSPKRCLNTVQNIMNWFTFVNSPTWFWIHALKPARNSEAAGYALGFWNPVNQEQGSASKPVKKGVAAGAARTSNGLEVKRVSPAFIGKQIVSTERELNTNPGNAFAFTISNKADVYLIVDPSTDYTPPADWKKSDMVLVSDREERVYVKRFKQGKVNIPSNTGKDKNGNFGIPHAAVVVALGEADLQIGPPDEKNPRLLIERIEARNEIDTDNIEPGHWVYNNYNWFALAGFLKHMPWNCRRYAVAEDEVRKDQRIMAYKTPEGKMVIVVTNRGPRSFTFNIEAGSRNSFKGYRYTPEEAGTDFKGIPAGSQNGDKLLVELPAMSWDFWVEQ